MNVERVIDAHERLAADRERLQALGRELVAQESELLAEKEADWQDRATSETTANLLESVGALEHAKLLKIEGALKRIREGTYGVCVGCGCAIDPLRLGARPEAEHCSDCSAEGSTASR